MKIGRLHVLTDFLFQQKYAHAELARLAIEGGADTIQFRQKAGTCRHKLFSAKRTAAICKETGTQLIIDDHLDIMQAVDAQGVHLGRTDFPVADARLVVGKNKVIGATANSLKEVTAGAEAGADYIGYGPIYYSDSKANLASIQGLDGLKKACQLVDIPVIAIAGITANRVQEVLDAGAHGVAIMSAISTADDPSAETRAFRNAIDAFFLASAV
ncbi:MAG: thiamine phosphate synthase [Rhodothermales bacterium]